MEILLWCVFGFVLGSLPFSVRVGHLASGQDICQVGDHNPGATNVLRQSGMGWYLFALTLDISKGALPLGLAAQIAGLNGWELVPIALSSPLGHAFSPFLGGRGGKAIAVTFGTWIGLTLWKVPLISLGLLVIFSLLVIPPGWAVLLALAGTAASIAVWLQNSVLLAVFLTQSILLIYTHHQDIRRRPSLRIKNR